MRARRGFLFFQQDKPAKRDMQPRDCIHQFMPLRRDEANLLNGLLTPGFFSTMPHALRNAAQSSQFIGLMPLFFEALVLLTSAATTSPDALKYSPR